jgi:hypothetical protein
MRFVFVAGLLGLALAGCQTPQQSLAIAQDVCVQAGNRPGTRAYQNCVNANYTANRVQSQQTADAVAAGATAGLVGGAIVAASTYPTYGPGYYYGPGPYWGGYYGPRYYYGPRPYWRRGWCGGWRCY